VVSEGHYDAGVEKSVLLSKKIRRFHSRLTPTLAAGRQFNSQGTNEVCFVKDLLHQSEIRAVHLEVTFR